MHRRENDTLLDWLTLSFLPRLGAVSIRRLSAAFGSPGEVLQASKARLRQVKGITERQLASLCDADSLKAAREHARHEQQKCQAVNISLIPFDHPAYPELLAAIHDPPILLWVRGNIKLLSGPAIAIVGSRAASEYGLRVSRKLARDLVQHKLILVSGMALGIDGEAHRGALAGGGSTVGVLGCGLDVVYPRAHARLYGEVIKAGALVSEYPLGTRPDGFRFPARNRIISGLSRGVVVVEAAGRSGSLITARMALEQGREVFAVPGRVDSMKSNGSHRLLKEGAGLVRSAQDILEELDFLKARSSEAVNPVAEPVELSEMEMQVYKLLDVYPITIDEIIRAVDLSATAIIEILLMLELKGAVRQLPGQQYERVGEFFLD